MTSSYVPAMSLKGFIALYKDMQNIVVVDCEVVEDADIDPLNDITNVADAIAVCDAIADRDPEGAWAALHRWAFPRWLSLSAADAVRVNQVLSRYHAASTAEFD